MSKTHKTIGTSGSSWWLCASTRFAATLATAAVTPSITVSGGKVFIHTAVSNLTLSNEALTVTRSTSGILERV